MWRSRYSEMFISTYIAKYKRNSLQKSLCYHRCYFGFILRSDFVTWSVAFALVISENGNANSQVGKSKTLMHRFSQLISVSFDSFDINCTDNISMLQNSILLVVVTVNLMRRSPVFPCIETAIPSFRHSRCRCTCFLHFWSVIGSQIHAP